MDAEAPPQCLELVQMISTIPPAFPNVLNTCGRITVHSTGRYVLVSNRGHDSICVLSVEKNTGLLQVRKAVVASMFAVMKRKENAPMERDRDIKRRVHCGPKGICTLLKKKYGFR